MIFLTLHLSGDLLTFILSNNIANDEPGNKIEGKDMNI
jgi:hypothetical protein